MPDLWSSLFLLVPVVSTTFASVERMLGYLPPEALGWLLVDEAGQALPQAVVGAMMRTRRAIVVGDPLQIEPVTSLPTSLAEAICTEFGVDPKKWNAPAASVQSVSDSTTIFGTEFEREIGSTRVGFPLLVHRRCAEPMFSISNAAAYSNLMVHATQSRVSAIRNALGPSRWIDVPGGRTEDKWCEAEGDVVIMLLRQLVEAHVDKLDLYIVSPFVIVAQKLRERIQASGLLRRWADDPWKWTRERVGTVHTVQGREADSVILVLGASLPGQHGARSWAGAKPNLLNVAATRASAAETAFANALTNNKDGFTTLLAVVAPNLLVKPPTVIFNKVTIKNATQAVQMFGPAQHGVAKAVADSVASGVIPVTEADDLFICVGVFIHWDARDNQKIQDFNYQATKEAIFRAVVGEPTPARVAAQRNVAMHPFAH